MSVLRQTMEQFAVGDGAAPEAGQTVEFVGGVNLFIIQTKGKADGVSAQMGEE